ncbi:hypothetical protein KCU65_g4466, partial [Aureobasidium melanogenum]
MKPSTATTMVDDETRRLILRLQMDDLASIWASSTTSTDDGTELDADVSLRLYRHELRTADQQIDDRISARAAAADDLRQRDAMEADRDAARRLFQALNPGEPLPELTDADQLALTDHSGSSNAPVEDETSSVPGPLQCSEQSDMRASPSPASRHTIASTSGVKRSASHLDTMTEPAPKGQANEPTILAASQVKPPWGFTTGRTQLESGPSAPANSDVPAQSSAPAPFTFGSLKRPAEAEGVSPPPSKRQETLSKTSPFVFVPSHSPARETTSPVVSGPTATSLIKDPIAAMFGRSSPAIIDISRFGRDSIMRLDSGSRPLYPPRTNRKSDRTASTGPAEAPTSQTIPVSRQPVTPGQQLVVEPVQSAEVECVACLNEVPRTETYSNSCGHPYCRKCVNRLFKKAAHDDSLWPPQCCQAEFSIENVKPLLREGLIPVIEARQAEMSVPILDRIYCVDCSTFIPEDFIQEDNADCPVCWTSMCTECKEKAHTGGCQNKLEQDIKDLEALAEEEGWKKCSKCLMIVEHHTGCAHMT